MKRSRHIIFFLLMSCLLAAKTFGDDADFFNIGKVSFQNKPEKKNEVIFVRDTGSRETMYETFLPHLKVPVSTGERINSAKLVGKAYFFDKNQNLIAALDSPTPIIRGGASGSSAMPVFFEKKGKEDIYFVLPPGAARSSDWTAVIVFGDQYSVAVACFPQKRADIREFDFPEKELWLNPKKMERGKAVNPLIEHTVSTGIQRYPQITLLVRKPIGAADFSDTEGVLALCVLAPGVDAMKRQLQEADYKDDLGAIFDFAEKHRLAIICWGSRSLWNPKANWNEMDKREQNQISGTFDDVAKAWQQGVASLVRKYGIPSKGFLLFGASGAAQYAARLALRSPQHFLAVYIHVPSSFDKPTVNGGRILWCLTTGEEESGYDRSLDFLEECQKLKYPMIYKAIPGLGHASHAGATNLGLTFLEYALELRKSGNYTEGASGNLPASFRTPPYRGDVFRQKVYSAKGRTRNLPPALLVPLPTEAIARAWEAAR